MSYKQTFLQFPRLGQSVDGSPLIRADLAVELAGDADKEIATLRDEMNQWKEAAQSYENRGNPFDCGHAMRFIWRDPAGQTACAACRMFATERLERERDELAERLAASEKLTAAYGQQERIACQVNVELTELLTATEKAATDFRARAEAEFERLRAEINAICLMHPGTIAEITAMTDAAKKRLMGGGA